MASVCNPALAPSNSALVMPTEDLRQLASADGFSGLLELAGYGPGFDRNDGRLGDLSGPQFSGIRIVEVRHREYLRIINGRPSEFTTINTRSIRRDIVP